MGVSLAAESGEKESMGKIDRATGDGTEFLQLSLSLPCLCRSTVVPAP